MTATLQIVSEEPIPYARCPSCETRLDLPALVGQRWTVRSPRDVVDRLAIHMGGLPREELWVLALNARNRVIHTTVAYKGNVSAAVVRVGELFRDAIRLDASGVILAHCHPSQDATPSPDDLHLTAEAIAAGRLLDVDVLDHIVIGGFSSYVSLRDRGVSFDRPIRSISKES